VQRIGDLRFRIDVQTQIASSSARNEPARFIKITARSLALVGNPGRSCRVRYSNSQYDRRRCG